MTADELNAIRYLTIGLAKETFKQDYESFGKEDDDYIREKLALDNYCKGVEDVLNILENMKQVQKWIPVTERLPEESDDYLITNIAGDVEMAYFAHPKDYAISKGEWREIWYEDDVIAWMPLPKSYKEESER